MFRIAKESKVDNDLFQAEETYKVITVNCIGAMGRGIALDCKNRYPNIYKDYREQCKRGDVQPGSVYVYDEEKIILLPTKRHFKDPSSVRDIEDGIIALVTRDVITPFGSVALPPLGMVNGWLKHHQRIDVIEALRKCCEKSETIFRLYLPDSIYNTIRCHYDGRR